MTCVEFFDKTSVRNISSCLALSPEKVILVGGDQKKMKRYAKIYREIFADRGSKTEFSVRTVNVGDIDAVVSLLSEIIEENEECVLDLEGGEDILLVAVGMVYERFYDKKIKTLRVNLVSNTVSIGHDEYPIVGLSVEENIRLYGGRIIYDDHMPEGTHIWKLDDDFKRDIDLAFDVCRRDVSRWNREIKGLQQADKHRRSNRDELFTEAFFEEIGERLEIRIMPALVEAGLISDYKKDKKRICYRYKNHQVKKLLTKAGQVLEMKIYSVAKSVTDKNGRAVYDDVLNGVCIDWDGFSGETGNAVDVENEIDVMMTKGAVPIFISCKNGMVKVDELYKLNTVARRFGGDYAKKVLVATALDRSGEAFKRDFCERAEDMGIRVIENPQFMKEEELSRVIKNLWRT